MHKKYFIGCSGYYYPGWKNEFYPKGLAPKNWLNHYSSVFNTVELNGTFYRTPKLADLQRYAANTPDGFKFSVKMSRYITHVLKMKNCADEVHNFQSLMAQGLKDKLSCFLFQMPPSFHYTEDNMKNLLATVPAHAHNVVELRHISWWNEAVLSAFKKAGITFCNVDFPGLDTYFMQSTDVFYLRLHGKPELFKSPYSTERLQQLYKQFPPDCKQYFIYFNNTFYDAAYKNALELMALANKK